MSGKSLLRAFMVVCAVSSTCSAAISLDVSGAPTAGMPGYSSYVFHVFSDAGPINAVDFDVTASYLHQVNPDGDKTVFSDLNDRMVEIGFNPLHDSQVLLNKEDHRYISIPQWADEDNQSFTAIAAWNPSTYDVRDNDLARFVIPSNGVAEYTFQAVRVTNDPYIELFSGSFGGGDISLLGDADAPTIRSAGGELDISLRSTQAVTQLSGYTVYTLGITGASSPEDLSLVISGQGSSGVAVGGGHLTLGPDFGGDADGVSGTQDFGAYAEGDYVQVVLPNGLSTELNFTVYRDGEPVSGSLRGVVGGNEGLVALPEPATGLLVMAGLGLMVRRS